MIIMEVKQKLISMFLKDLQVKLENLCPQVPTEIEEIENEKL